jgi:hypothetical protein
MRKQDEIGKTTIAIKKAVEKATKQREIEIATTGIRNKITRETIMLMTGLTESELDDLYKQIETK